MPDNWFLDPLGNAVNLNLIRAIGRDEQGRPVMVFSDGVAIIIDDKTLEFLFSRTVGVDPPQPRPRQMNLDNLFADNESPEAQR